MNERLSGLVNGAQDQYVQNGAQSSGWRYGLNAAGYIASEFFPKSVGEAAFAAVGGPVIGKAIGLVGSVLPKVAPGIAGTLQRGMGPSSTLLDEVRAKGIGFDSGRRLRAAMSPATGEHIHHIVEQTPANVARFGAQTIHNTANAVPVASTTHIGKGSISAYYSGKDVFTNGLRVREWLSTQSFDDQYRFGLRVLSDFGAIK